MAHLKIEGNRLVRRFDDETIWIEPWGVNSLRVRVTRRGSMEPADWALLTPTARPAEIEIEGESARVTQGELTAQINREGWLRFVNRRGELLLEEYWRDRRDLSRFSSPLNLAGRELQPIPGSGSYQITQRFEASAGEKIFGLGQYQDPHLDKKGSLLELAHRNAQCSVPFALSNRGYGMLWNNPAVGRVTFGKNLTEWSVRSSLQLDYWITAGDSPAQIEEQYAAVTGTVPMMPDYCMGFIQCKLRYRTQAELLEAAREHRRRNLPLDVIVADFFHWTLQGEWKFDPVDWPDVEGMVAELRSMGIELMVSIWPTVDTRSENFREMLEAGYLLRTDRGLRINMNWMGETIFFDPTQQGAREFVWSRVKRHYYDKGIRLFWLDEAEPEFGKYDFDNYRYHLGPALEVTNLYPLLYAQTFYDGLKAAGETQVLSLVRAAWAGSQRYGALVWSGDVHSSFRSLRDQLAAGLSISLAGIPWWTTDIGGFHGGDPNDPAFRELLIRWFQWGAFCPVFRLHGDRIPQKPLAEPFRAGVRQFTSGADNEVWCYGEQAYPILVRYLELRERLRPYIREQMRAAHVRGTPVMRPLFYDFPADPLAWDTEDAYLFGPDILVAPVLQQNAREREVYLPAGASWKHAWSDRSFAGGRTIRIETPIEDIPIFLKNGAPLA
ncbi:MAG: glycoside hydrolase family 31 protein [Deltaproteobacteria bacterium]